jgi:hypothetical protein
MSLLIGQKWKCGSLQLSIPLHRCIFIPPFSLWGPGGIWGLFQFQFKWWCITQYEAPPAKLQKTYAGCRARQFLPQTSYLKDGCTGPKNWQGQGDKHEWEGVNGLADLGKLRQPFPLGLPNPFHHSKQGRIPCRYMVLRTIVSVVPTVPLRNTEKAIFNLGSPAC